MNIILFFIIFVMIFVLLGYNDSFADKMKSPKSITINTKVSYTNYTHEGWSYRIYKKYISPIRGSQCPMYPSCSTYAKDAFEEYGFIRGFVMMSDRLTRCGQDLHKYQIFWLNRREYAIDPAKYKSGIHKEQRNH